MTEFFCGNCYWLWLCVDWSALKWARSSHYIITYWQSGLRWIMHMFIIVHPTILSVSLKTLLQVIQFFHALNHFTNFGGCDVIASNSTRAQFLIYVLHYSFVHEAWSTNRKIQGRFLRLKILKRFERDFSSNFVIIVNLLETSYCFYTINFLISAQIWLSSKSEESSSQKPLLLNKRLGNSSSMYNVMYNAFS